MGTIDFSVCTENSTVSFSSDFREDGKPYTSGTPTLNQALTDAIARIAGAYDIAGALEREWEKAKPFVDAVVAAGGPKLVAELNIDAGTSFVDESHPHAEALKRSFEGQLAPDYGVANMTPGEVQRLLESKDAELGQLREAIEGLQADLIIRRQNVADLEGQNEELRETVRELRLQGTAYFEQKEAQKAQIAELRDLNAKLGKETHRLQARNDNQKRTLESLDANRRELIAKLAVFEAGAAGVTKLQEERDAARNERDSLIEERRELDRKLRNSEKARKKVAEEARDQAEQLGRVLVAAAHSAKAEVMADTGALSGEMIHKSDACVYIDNILKRVAPERADA